jgi:hypothetical protein
MSDPFPPAIDRLVRKELATGAYKSEDDILVEAGIREGLADIVAGRVRPLGDVDSELRAKHGIAHNV